MLLATHQTEDVSALCDRVIVLGTGAICFDGTVSELIATAAGQVWLGHEATHGALAAMRTGTGEVRSVGGQPGADSREAELATEDADLLLRTRHHIQ